MSNENTFITLCLWKSTTAREEVIENALKHVTKLSRNPATLNEPRKASFWKFFDKSSIKIGKQSINCRLDHMRLFNCPWSTENLFKDSIRILQKRTFFSYFNENDLSSKH